MNTDLLTVTTAETRFGELRSVTIDGQAWFVAKDVCKALGLTNTSKALLNITSSYVQDFKVPGKRGGRPVKLICDFGLNALVLQSRKPAARAFQRMLNEEVIPSILKHGVYVTGQASMTDAQLRAALGERGERLIEGTRAQRHARIAADVANFKAMNGREPTSRERFWLEKP
jgi:prophage antirepressor-like protein